MFEGPSELSLDPKGRIAVPARHREELNATSAGRLVITIHPHRCLLIYPESAWAPKRDEVLRAPSFDANAALVKRMFVGMAQTEAMDASGRVLISPALRRYAQLEKQVCLIGQGNYFELWSDAGWQEQLEKMFQLGPEILPAGMENFSL